MGGWSLCTRHSHPGSCICGGDLPGRYTLSVTPRYWYRLCIVECLSVVLCTEIWAIFGSFELDVSTFLAVSERRAEVSQQGGERQESSGTVG